LKNSTGYGKFSRNPALLRQSLTLAEIGGFSLVKVKQCWSLKQEIKSTKSGLPSFAHFWWNGKNKRVFIYSALINNKFIKKNNAITLTIPYGVSKMCFSFGFNKI
jgi:hypothetical protein